MDRSNSFFLPCDDHCCAVHIDRCFPDKPEYDEFFMSFWACDFYSKQEKWYRRLGNRILLAFKVLTKGDYFLNEICIDKKTMEEFKEYLDKQLQK